MAGQYRIIDQVIMIFRTYFQMFFNFIYADICLVIYTNIKTGVSNWKIKNGLNYLMILCMLIIFYFCSDLILLFFKVKHANISYLSSLFKIGLIIPVFMGISFALKQLMFAFSKNQSYIRITILSTLLSLLLQFALLKTIGLKGAFISTIFAEFFIILSYILVLKSSLANKTQS